MILVLVIGLFLGGSAVALFARGLLRPRLQATETVAEVGSYGFKARARAVAREHRRRRDLGLRGQLDRLALAVGDIMARRFPSLSVEATRRHLMAAGMYTTNP